MTEVVREVRGGRKRRMQEGREGCTGGERRNKEEGWKGEFADITAFTYMHCVLRAQDSVKGPREPFVYKRLHASFQACTCGQSHTGLVVFQK